MLAKLKARLGRVETWVWEQLVLGVLVGVAVWAQIAGVPDRVADPRSLRTIGLAVLTGVMVMVGQKVRSTADRQREANEAAGIGNAPLECSRAQEFYGALFQALSIVASMVTAYTLWQQLIVLYVAAYPLWRRFYRARIKKRTISDDELVGFAADLVGRQALKGEPSTVRYHLDVQFDDPAIGGVHTNPRCVDDQDEKTLVSPRW